MRASKGSHKISYRGIDYRWRATGNDGYITVGIWPAAAPGSFIDGTFKYHEDWIDQGNGVWLSAGNQIVVTNRLVARILEHAIATHGYDPHIEGKDLNLGLLEDRIEWDDAVRAVRKRNE